MIKKRNTMYRCSTNDNQRETLRVVFRVATLSVALLGVSVQIYHISNIYFRYSTTTEVSISVESEIDSPALSLCIMAMINGSDDEYIRNTLDGDEYQFYHSYKNYTKRRLKNQPNFTESYKYREKYFSIRKKLYILNKIFKDSPNVSIDTCYYRDPTDERKVLVIDGTGCKSIFPAKKYVTEDFVCYRFQLANQVKYGFKRNMEVGFSSLPGLLYIIIMGFSIPLEGDAWRWKIKPYLHSPESYGDISRLYPVSRLNVGKHNYGRLTFAKYSVTKLPRPYYTKCRNGPSIYSQTDCIKQCSTSQMDGLGVVPYSEEYTEEDLELYGNRYLGFDQRLSGKLFRKNVQNCVHACDDNCYDEWYTSTTRELENRTSIRFPNFGIQVELPNRPLTAIEHKPQLLINEYIIYVMSCLGTWFGICFLDLNPFKSTSGANDRPNMGKDSRILVQDIKLLTEKVRSLDLICNQLITKNKLVNTN